MCISAMARSKCQSDGAPPVSRACAVRSGVDVREADARKQQAESRHGLTWGQSELCRRDSFFSRGSVERLTVRACAAEACRNAKSSGKTLRVVGTDCNVTYSPAYAEAIDSASAHSCRSTVMAEQWRLFAYEHGSTGSRGGLRARASTHPPHSPPQQVTHPVEASRVGR